MPRNGVGLGGKGGDRDMERRKGGRIRALGSGLGTQFWTRRLSGWAHGGQGEGSRDKLALRRGRGGGAQRTRVVLESARVELRRWGCGVQGLENRGAERRDYDEPSLVSEGGWP